MPGSWCSGTRTPCCAARSAGSVTSRATGCGSRHCRIWEGCEAALREAARVLVPGGRLGLTFWGRMERIGLMPGLASEPGDASARRRTPPESAISEAHHLPQHNPDVIWTGVNPSAPSSSTPEWRICAQCAALEPESSQAHSRRSVRSHFETPAALRDDRWPRPSREIRLRSRAARTASMLIGSCAPIRSLGAPRSTGFTDVRAPRTARDPRRRDDFRGRRASYLPNAVSAMSAGQGRAALWRLPIWERRMGCRRWIGR